MQKQIARWSYWGGVAGVAVSVVWRIFTLLGVFPKHILGENHALTYETVMKGALMLLAITIASASYVSSQANRA